MKILHVIDSAGMYGAEVMLLNLAKEQKKQGLRPLVLVFSKPGEQIKLIEQIAKLECIPYERFEISTIPSCSQLKRLQKLIVSQDIDLIHSHGYKGNIIFGLILRVCIDRPVLVTAHGWTSSGRNDLKLRFFECLDFFSLKFVDHLILVSKEMLALPRISKLYSKGRVSVVNNGLPILWSERCEIEDDVASFVTGKIVIGSLGRLSLEKGYSFLIDAFASLVGKDDQYVLLIIGDGPELLSLQRKITFLGLDKRIMLAGFRIRGDRYLSCFDYYVNSSLTEGLPMSILEAVRSKIPVMAPRIGSIPELLLEGEGGFLYDAGCEEGMQRAIYEMVIDRKEIEVKTLKAYENFELHYTSSVMAHEYDEIYCSSYTDR